MTILAAGAAAKGILATLAMMAAQGTLLALLALVLVRAGRMRPSWQAAVWLVVLAKFVLPWGPALPWSLSDLVAYLRHDDGGATLAGARGAAAAATGGALGPAVGWLVLAAAWATGAALVIARAVRRHRGAAREACRGAAAPDAAVLLVGELAAYMRVKPPRLVVGDPAMGPHVVARIIVVPPALLADRQLLRAALLHELAHLRRRDAIGRALQIAATAMFFWWPIVRIVGRRLDAAREAACDAWALEASEVSRPAYARLLVQMAALRAAAAPGLASPNALEARVAAVLAAPARARLGLAHTLGLVVWIALALGGARTATARGQRNVCRYTPQIAEALYQAYPQADLDGDGALSRDEACEFQLELRQTAAPADQVSLLDEPLCCNCDPGDGQIPPATTTCLGDE